MELRPNIDTERITTLLLKFRDKVRREAHQHALVLTFMALMFMITWAVIIISTIVAAAHGN